MNNEVLIKELRWNADVYKGYTMDDEDKQMMRDAAAALEAADKRIAELMPKEGEWIESNRRPRSAQFYCSVCQRTCYDIQPTRDKAWTKRCRYRYCPNCGARMKGEHDEQIH